MNNLRFELVSNSVCAGKIKLRLNNAPPSLDVLCQLYGLTLPPSSLSSPVHHCGDPLLPWSADSADTV